MNNNKLEKSLCSKEGLSLNNKIKEVWTRYMKTSNFDYFITITFKYDVSYKSSLNYINTGLHYVNSFMFGRNYKKSNKSLEGFAVVEGKSVYNIHYHFLIKGDNIILKSQNKCFRDVWVNKFCKIKHYNPAASSYTYKVFSPKGIDFQHTYSVDVVDYCLKEINSGSTENIMPLSKDGLCCA